MDMSKIVTTRLPDEPACSRAGCSRKSDCSHVECPLRREPTVGMPGEGFIGLRCEGTYRSRGPGNDA